MSTLPCTGHTGLYDLVLFDEDAEPAARTQALHRAAALCAGCPAPCEQKVTADSGPRELVLLADDWMPPAREGRTKPKTPPKRVAIWARMATEYADQGVPLAQIAERLCVTEATAAALLQQARRAAA